VGVANQVWRGLGWLVVVLAIFEVGLRAAEPFLRPAPSKVEGARYTILCEGDSFTYGIGGRSFPSQLEELLNQRHGAGTFRAINAGVPGINSAVLADNLEAHFLEHQPDFAIVLIGENNSWNSLRVAQRGLPAKVDALLMYSRVYKFIKVSATLWGVETFHEAADPDSVEAPILEESEGIGLEFPSGEFSPDKRVAPDVPPAELERFLGMVPLIERGEYEACVEAFGAFVADHPDVPQGYSGLGSCQMRLNRLEEAAATFRRGTEARFDDSVEELYFLQGSALQRLGRVDEAAAAFKGGLKHFPRSRALGWGWSENYHRAGRTYEALAIVEELPETADNDVVRYLRKVSEQSKVTDLDAAVSEAFEEDLNRIVDLADQHSVTLIFSSYPDTTYKEVAKVAAERKQVYVSFPQHFEKRFTSREEYISPDRCHCNTEGYQLMAEVFAETIGGFLGPASGSP
jgi:lysophospholipase L1-like esterase